MILTTIISIAFSMNGITASAQDRVEKSDSVATAIRVKALREQQAQLKKQIAIEDKKRNQRIEGVSAANQELLNDRQDSICIDLRSQLTRTELELKEVQPDKVPAQVGQQYNALIRKQPAKPSPQPAGKTESKTKKINDVLKI